MRSIRSTRRNLAAASAAALVLLGVVVEAGAKTCSHELTPNEMAFTEIPEVTCDRVAVRLMPIQSEMYYHRWSGEIQFRAIEGDGEARVDLAAYDGDGALIGTLGLVRRGIDRKTKKAPFRMEGMFSSLAEVRKIVLSVSVPNRPR